MFIHVFGFFIFGICSHPAAWMESERERVREKLNEEDLYMAAEVSPSPPPSRCAFFVFSFPVSLTLTRGEI
jgi:hypothetical protein